jgi:hypothetical protein
LEECYNIYKSKRMRNIDESFVNSVLLDWAANCNEGSPTLDEQGIESLYNSLISNGLNEEQSYSVTSIIAEKGKHPERQAYNKNGLLVTFPTPEYKARALAKGTHFEKNPKVGQSNLFGGGQQAPNQPAPTGDGNSVPNIPMDSADSELPRSDTQQSQTPPAQKEVPEPGAPGTPAPPTSGGSTTGGSVSTPAQGQLATEPIQPVSQPTNVSPPPAPPTPPPVQKTPEEIAAEKEVIKQILNTGDTLPTVPGVGGVGITEEIKKLIKIAVDMEFKNAVKVLSKLL